MFVAVCCGEVLHGIVCCMLLRVCCLLDVVCCLVIAGLHTLLMVGWLLNVVCCVLKHGLVCHMCLVPCVVCLILVVVRSTLLDVCW